jgi:hypothetical protein
LPGGVFDHLLEAPRESRRIQGARGKCAANSGKGFQIRGKRAASGNEILISADNRHTDSASHVVVAPLRAGRHTINQDCRAASL